MATIYKVECKSTNDETVLLEITDSLIPFNDKWECDNESAWGLENGPIAWAEGALHLLGVGSTPPYVLDGFTKSTSPGEAGAGEKQYPEGTFPPGSFEWYCLSKE